MEQIIEEYGGSILLFLVGITYLEVLKLIIQIF